MEIDFDKLCKELEISISLSSGKKSKVEYHNALKPSNYYVPQFVTTNMALSENVGNAKMAWFAEIFVDNRCIFRSYYIPSNDDFEMAEKIANEKLIQHIFSYGIMSSKKVLEEMTTIR